MACWLVFGFNTLLWHGQFSQYGILPRRISSLPGILWAPFLHLSFKHLVGNTVPLLVLGGILCARAKGTFAGVTIAGIIAGGGLTWLFGREAIHIGASGLVFSYFGYLASLAYFNRNVATLLLSALCIVGYGGIIRGILPTSQTISWEGHLAGLVAGIATAWIGSRLKGASTATVLKPPEITTKIDR